MPSLFATLMQVPSCIKGILYPTVQLSVQFKQSSFGAGLAYLIEADEVLRLADSHSFSFNQLLIKKR